MPISGASGIPLWEWIALTLPTLHLSAPRSAADPQGHVLTLGTRSVHGDRRLALRPAAALGEDRARRRDQVLIRLTAAGADQAARGREERLAHTPQDVPVQASQSAVVVAC
ncbi:hypothetical protein [Streptomyces xantholiticus]|uniref:Secreted protein n=1 Tax=Streptomyces xantholiticus TaxID=68285 RepID=A0ABV1V4K3_9ACTN